MEQPNKSGRAFESAVEIILQWDTTASSGNARKPVIFDGGDPLKVNQYLRAVDEIQQSISSTGIKSRANDVMRIAMARLQEDFRAILMGIESNAILMGTESNEFDALSNPSSSAYSSSLSASWELQEYRAPSNKSICDLTSILQRMSSAGYLSQCIQVYVSVRKSFLDKRFRRFRIEKLSTREVNRLEWGMLSTKIWEWIQAAKVCVRVLFKSEKQLCEKIFEFLGIDDECFVETVKDHAILLFNFSEAVCVSRRSCEKMFKILDLYTALLDLLPDINSIFQSNSLEFIRVQAANTVSQLAEATREILSEFEKAVFHELTKFPSPGGTIHPLTEYVMNYMSCLILCKKNLVELIVSKPSTSLGCFGDLTFPDMESKELEEQIPLALHMIWIILVLQFNLEGKSKHYEDVSLVHLFMINNVHYIVKKIKGLTDLRELMGDYIVDKLTGNIQQATSNYLMSTWDEVLHPLDTKTPNAGWCLSFKGNILKGEVERFYVMFECARQTQATWLVPDLQLRKELRQSILKMLIPSYKSFMDRFHVLCGKQSEKYMKYSVDDLEKMISDFFKGDPVSNQLRKSRVEWWKMWSHSS